MPCSRLALSAVLITQNVASQLEECLKYLQFADEIIVVDAHSTDHTREIAMRYGARVVVHRWCGFGAQKRFAVAKARYDWVLCIDADEYVPIELAQAIETLLIAPQNNAYQIPRCNYFLGRYLRHGEGYPDWSLRLFDRRYANWSEDAVHEKVIVTPGESIGRITGGSSLLHHSAETLTAYLDKQNRYTSLQAQTLYEAGVQATALKLVLAPVSRFVKFYLLRRGFLDGIPGLIHIVIGCFFSFVKYAKLRALSVRSVG